MNSNVASNAMRIIENYPLSEKQEVIHQSSQLANGLSEWPVVSVLTGMEHIHTMYVLDSFRQVYVESGKTALKKVGQDS